MVCTAPQEPLIRLMVERPLLVGKAAIAAVPRIATTAPCMFEPEMSVLAVPVLGVPKSETESAWVSEVLDQAAKMSPSAPPTTSTEEPGRLAVGVDEERARPGRLPAGDAVDIEARVLLPGDERVAGGVDGEAALLADLRRARARVVEPREIGRREREPVAQARAPEAVAGDDAAAAELPLHQRQRRVAVVADRNLRIGAAAVPAVDARDLLGRREAALRGPPGNPGVGPFSGVLNS